MLYWNSSSSINQVVNFWLKSFILKLKSKCHLRKLPALMGGPLLIFFMVYDKETESPYKTSLLSINKRLIIKERTAPMSNFDYKYFHGYFFRCWVKVWYMIVKKCVNWFLLLYMGKIHHLVVILILSPKKLALQYFHKQNENKSTSI